MTEEQFVSLADQLARARKATKKNCPIILRHRSGRGYPFPCIHTDRDALLRLLEQKRPQRRSHNVRIELIAYRMFVAVPRTKSWRLNRAEQLLETCHISPADWTDFLEQ